MLRRILGRTLIFIAGFVAGSLCLYFLFYAPYLEEQRKHYHNQGVATGMLNAATAIKNEFGVTHDRTAKTVFDVKYRSIVAIEIDGVKTVREYEYQANNDL